MGSMKFMAPLMGFRTIMGTMCDPHSGWLIMRSLGTLKIRMERTADNAKKIAEFLRDHEKVAAVQFLGFLKPASLAHEIFQRQSKSAGSTFSFDIHGGEAEAFRLLDSLQIIKLAVSLGGTESLMEHPYSMTHADVPDDVKNRLGMTQSMVRISVGIENADDLIADLDQALAQV